MGATTDLVALAQRFDADRRHLRSVAFGLLGSVADADDAVQSAWLKASRADFGAVDNLSGWFTTITAREALDQLRARKRRAERPLAEPDELDRLAGTASAPAEEDALLAESVSNACSSCSTASHPHSASPSCCTTCSPCRSRRSPRC